MKKVLSLICVVLVCVFGLSACGSFSLIKSPTPKEEMYQKALSCFSKYQNDMQEIISAKKTTGKTKWCENYTLLRDDQYEFVLEQTGFTGTNTRAGIIYIPNNTPNSSFKQHTENKDIYSYYVGGTDSYYLERIEENWFFFYNTYDF